MNPPASEWFDGLLLVLLAAGNLLALPLAFWLMAGLLARGRWLAAQFRCGPAARQDAGTGDRLGS